MIKNCRLENNNQCVHKKVFQKLSRVYIIKCMKLLNETEYSVASPIVSKQ